LESYNWLVVNLYKEIQIFIEEQKKGFSRRGRDVKSPGISRKRKNKILK